METVVIEKTNPIKSFIERHKVGLAVTGTAIIAVVVNRAALRQHDEFLKEKDLYDEFYTPSDEEM